MTTSVSPNPASTHEPLGSADRWQSVAPDDRLPIDPQLVQQTRQEIRLLVREISQLCQSDLPPQAFYGEFLRRVVSALASDGGAIWSVAEGERFELQYQINLRQTGLLDDNQFQQQHRCLLRQIHRDDSPALIPPGYGPGDEYGGNPTDHLLIMAKVKVDDQAPALVEIFQRPTSGPATQRGYLRFLAQMCDMAGDYLKNRRLRALQDRQRLWERLERFLVQVHRSLDLLPTAYAIANEGREVIGADRVSVAIARGRRYRVEVVSGLDSIDRRAEQVKLLERLTTLVMATGEPLWYGDATDELPPQVDAALQTYLDQSHSKSLWIIPLRPAGSDTTTRSPHLGALIVERLEQSGSEPGIAERCQLVAQHGGVALASALQHNRIFLRPFWQWLGQASWLVQSHHWPKTLLALAVVASLVVGGAVVQQDFFVAAQGTLQPAVQRDVFAPIDGTVVTVPVRHADLVQRGQLLVQLENSSLDYEITTVSGQLTTTRQQISAQARALAQSHRATPEEQSRLGGLLQELRQTETNLVQQLELLQQRQALLDIRCEFPGQVVTWEVAEKLLHRPVQRGQVLMTVVDPDREWELQLFVPERHMGHVWQAARDSQPGLPVTFMLSSHPGESFTGQVTEIQRTTQAYQDEPNAVLVRVAIDKSKLPQLHTETSVSAKINCGRQSAGFVWFHDLLAAVQAKILFWL
jgi:hypothetical protein